MRHSMRDSQLLPISRVNSYLSSTQLPEPSEYSQGSVYTRGRQTSRANSANGPAWPVSASTGQINHQQRLNCQHSTSAIYPSESSERRSNPYIDKRLLRSLVDYAKDEAGSRETSNKRSFGPGHRLSPASRKQASVEAELERHGSKINELVNQQNVLMTIIQEQSQEIQRLTTELGRVAESVNEEKQYRTPAKVTKSVAWTPERRTPLIERRNGYEVMHDPVSGLRYLNKKKQQESLEQHIYSKLYKELATIF